jgi:hypothetical protein
MGSRWNFCCGAGRKKNKKVDKWGIEKKKKRRKKARFLGYNRSTE